jgi:two-component system, NarL family, nitrate/nitrite response regulator NarL
VTEGRTPIRIVLVDDHELVRAGLRAVFAQREHLCIVGEAADGVEGLSLIQALRPDVALIDLTMPKMGGQKLIEHLSRIKHPTRTIALTMHDEPERMQMVVRAEARGYVVKTMDTARIIEAVEWVARGDLYFPGLGSEEVEVLSPREKETAILIVKGFKNLEIGAQLGIGIKTVETHRANIRRKWKVSTVAEIIAEVSARGWHEE